MERVWELASCEFKRVPFWSCSSWSRIRVKTCQDCSFFYALLCYPAYTSLQGSILNGITLGESKGVPRLGVVFGGSRDLMTLGYKFGFQACTLIKTAG